jgi:chemotaxis signal transduction protein
VNGPADDRTHIEAVLAERARVLAQPAAEIDRTATVEIVEFICGNERYAIESSYVYRMERMARVTPLPGAPRQFAGITNLHGRLIPLVELGALLGTPVCVNPTFILVLGERRAEIGLVVDEVRALRALPCDVLGTPAAAPRALVRHITSDGTAVIDGAAVFADPRLFVGDADATHEENAR